MTCAALLSILAMIVVNGAGVIILRVPLGTPTDGMTHGGIFPAIFGTICITLLMILMALPLGVAAADLPRRVRAAKGLGPRIIRAAVNNLAGVPSIVFGLFGLGFFIQFVGRNIDRVLQTGLLWGQPAMLWAPRTLAILTLPVVIVATEEALRAVPQEPPRGGVRARRDALADGPADGPAAGVSGHSHRRDPGHHPRRRRDAPILFTGCAYFLPRLPVTDVSAFR